MQKSLYLELKFIYETDEKAKEGKKYLEQVFGHNTNELDGMYFTRSGRRVRGGRFYPLWVVADDIFEAYQIRVTEILERFQKKFPTKLWNGFSMSTSISYMKEELLI